MRPPQPYTVPYSGLAAASRCLQGCFYPPHPAHRQLMPLMRITVYRVVTVTLTVTVIVTERVREIERVRVREIEMVECERFELCVFDDRIVITVVFIILSDVND